MNVTEALRAYEHVRLPFANHILQGSYSSGQMYEFWHDIKDDFEKLGPAIEHQWDWVKCDQPETQLEIALRFMNGRHESTGTASDTSITI